MQQPTASASLSNARALCTPRPSSKSLRFGSALRRQFVRSSCATVRVRFNCGESRLTFVASTVSVEIRASAGWVVWRMRGYNIITRVAFSSSIVSRSRTHTLAYTHLIYSHTRKTCTLHPLRYVALRYVAASVDCGNNYAAAVVCEQENYVNYKWSASIKENRKRNRNRKQ